MGEQEYIPRQRKQQSRKVECVGVQRKQESLTKVRVDRGLEGFINQARQSSSYNPAPALPLRAGGGA